jgi:hypothetical protein
MNLGLTTRSCGLCFELFDTDSEQVQDLSLTTVDAIKNKFGVGTLELEKLLSCDYSDFYS